MASSAERCWQGIGTNQTGNDRYQREWRNQLLSCQSACQAGGPVGRPVVARHELKKKIVQQCLLRKIPFA